MTYNISPANLRLETDPGNSEENGRLCLSKRIG